MKFRLRTLFCMVTVTSLVYYGVSAGPLIYLRKPAVRPNEIPTNPYTGPDYFECTLENGGILPFYIESFADFSPEMIVWRPTREGEDSESSAGWTFEVEWFSSIHSPKLPSWKPVLPGAMIQLRKDFTSNQADRRVRINLEVKDWLGRRYLIQSPKMKHYADGRVDQQATQTKPMNTKRRVSPFDF